MDLGLKNKIAIVTGASAGLGKEIAAGLAREGAKLAISGRRKDVLEASAEQIRDETGADLFVFAGDMTQEQESIGFVNRVIEKWGTVHVLVNNVGQAVRGHLGVLSQDDWQHGFETNLLSAVYCTKRVVPLMQEQKWGRIVNISALTGREPKEGLVVSNTLKSGLISFSKTLSRELAPHNILVNCISPGLITSPQNDRYFTREERDTVLKTIPLQRFGAPVEFADAVVFICSERSSYITGVNLIVDGGASHGI